MADFGVETCPTEFILAILGHLPLRDVASFSLASKRMLAITQTVLYSDITLEWIPDRKPELSRLIATLLQTLFWQPIFTPFGSWANATSTGTISKKLKWAWQKKLEDGNLDALATLLLCMAPNLRLFNLGQSFTVQNPILGDVLRQLFCCTDASQQCAEGLQFRNVRQIVMPQAQDHFHRRMGGNAADVLPLFYLPTIESLRVSIDDWPGTLPTASTLTSSAIERIREQNLVCLLKATPHLGRFRWTWIYSRGIYGHLFGFIDLDTLMDAMKPRQDGLFDLVIDAQCILGGQEIEPPFVDVRGSMSGLRKFLHVRKFGVPWVFYMGFSPGHGRSLLGQLPPNLETLVLTDYLMGHSQFNWSAGGRVDDYDSDDNEDPCARARVVIQGLQGATREVVPNLCQVVLAWYPEHDECDDEILEGLKSIRENYGIDVFWDKKF